MDKYFIQIEVLADSLIEATNIVLDIDKNYPVQKAEVWAYND